jgi:uncharacterized integral membrane protein
MRLLLLLALLIAIVAVVFALQNSTPVFIRFFGWQTQESMALVLLITFTVGVLFGLLVSVPALIQRMRKISQLKRQVDEQVHNLTSMNHKLAEATTQLAALQADPSLPRSAGSASNAPSPPSSQ